MKKLTVLLFFAFALSAQLHAQDSAKLAMKAFLDGKHYEFQPSTTTSGRGRTVHLDGGYFLQLNGDTLKCYLPYFGRAYSAPINTSESGYDFTSTSFSYEIAEGKKDSYRVTIKTKESVYNKSFLLTVYDNGTAYLQASSPDKQTVSYNGSVRPKQ
jgi:hypothetical protein